MENPSIKSIIKTIEKAAIEIIVKGSQIRKSLWVWDIKGSGFIFGQFKIKESCSCGFSIDPLHRGQTRLFSSTSTLHFVQITISIPDVNAIKLRSLPPAASF